jgi:hypothetical protein
MNYWSGHVWDIKRDVCLRCCRTAQEIANHRLECTWLFLSSQ